jgi:protease I
MMVMTHELQNVRVAFLVANEGIEEVELTQPWRAVADAGGQPELVAPASGMADTMTHLDHAGRFRWTASPMTCRPMNSTP